MTGTIESPLEETEVPAAGVSHLASLAPRWLHAVALGVLLVVLLPIIGTNGIFSADEGAVLFQAHRLEAGRGWVTPHPFPEADPDGVAFPVHLSERGSNGFVAYRKLPAYPVAVAASIRVLGVAGPYVLSILGLVGAAWAAAVVAQRIRAPRPWLALWVVGIGSPLFFDGYLVMAHTLAAAAVGVVAIGLTLVRSRLWLAVALAFIGTFGAVLLRSESMLMAAAVATAVVAFAMLRREWRWLSASGGVIAGAAMGTLVNRLWAQAILSEPLPGAPSPSLFTIAGRPVAFIITWLAPGVPLTGGLLLVVGAALLLVAGVLVARRTSDAMGAVMLAGIGTVLYVVRMIMWPGAVIAGLLIVFPFAVFALGCLRRPRGIEFVLVLSSVLFCLAVIATQYDVGGSGEWGGRYFAIAIPISVPYLLAVVSDRLSVPGVKTVALVACLVIATVTVDLIAVRVLVARHDATAQAGAELAAFARTVPPGDGGSSVIVALRGTVGRVSWREVERGRWLLAPDGQVRRVLERVEATGVRSVVVVGEDPSASLRDTPGARVVRTDTVGLWQVAVVELTPSG